MTERLFRATRDPFRVLLFLLTVMTISRIHQQFSWLSVLRPALVATGLAALFAFLKPQVVAKRPLLATWPAKVIALFLLWACLGAPFGISLGNTASFLLNVYFKTIVFAFLLIAAVRSTEDLKTLMWAYVIATLLLCYTSLFVFKMEHYGSGAGYDRLAHGDTYDSNDIGLVLVLGLAFTLLAFTTSKITGKLFCIGVLCLIGAGIAKTGSRGAFVGMLAIGVGLLFLIDRIPVVQRMAFIVVTIIGISWFAPPGYWKQMATLDDPQSDYNWSATNGRRQVAIRGMGYMMAYPIFGLGMHNFAKAECFISEKAINHEVGTGIRCTPPHNAYVEAGAELGIPGMALWLFIIPGSVVHLVMLRLRLPKAWARGDPEQQYLYSVVLYLTCGFLGYAFGSFFLSFAWTDVSYYLMAMLAGTWICVNDRLARDRQGIGMGPTSMTPPVVRRASGWRAAESEAAVARRRLASGGH